MLAPKGSTYNGRPTFANPTYLKKAQSEKPCLYEIPYDTSDLANIFDPDREETLTLEQESRLKLNKDLVKPYDYTKQNSLYEIFKPPSREYLDQLAHANEVRKKIWRKSFTQNDSFKFVSELKNEISADLEYVQSLEKEIDELESNKADFQTYMIYFSKSLSQRIELKKLIEKCKGKYVETKFDKPSVVRQPNALRIPKPSVLGKPTSFSDSLERKSFKKTKSVTKTNVSEGLSKPVTTHILPPTARKSVRNTNVIKPGMYQIDTRTTQTRAPQFPQTSRNTNPHVYTSTGVIHRTSVSRPQFKRTQIKDKVVQNNSQVKFKKTKVEDHHRISSISNKTKSITACNDILKSRTSNINVVCVTCGQCVFNSNHDACVSKFLNDVNAKSKKPQAMPIRPRKSIRRANQSVATPPKKTVASDSTIQNSKSYYRMLYEKTNKAWKWETIYLLVIVDLISTISLQETSTPTPIYFMAKASPTQAWLWHRRLSHLNFDTINLLSKKDIVNSLPKLKYVKDQLCSSCELSKAK
ncbi:retrovirus-related pol polyprotein from transposon TNT 1-94 [Tanacetum coccineum]